MKDVFIYDALRTPRGKGRKDGSLHEVTASRLSANVLNALKERNNLDGHAVEDVIWGNATQVMEQGACLARTAVLASDLDERIPGLSINRFCASGMEAVNLAANQIDVHSVSDRKPLYMDESADDWNYVSMGRSLGWTGVALKTCKTLSGALLSLCWAREHQMGLMVQDLTNPMLAQLPHVQLAAYSGTIMGVESNGMQFYPEASLPEARIHPGLVRRRDGLLDLSSLGEQGFGYRVEEVDRELPAGQL